MQQYDVLVIGAGPAGISAAVYAASRGKQVGLFEAQAVGGMIGRVSTVTHYASVASGEQMKKSLLPPLLGKPLVRHASSLPTA